MSDAETLPEPLPEQPPGYPCLLVCHYADGLSFSYLLSPKPFVPSG